MIFHHCEENLSKGFEIYHYDEIHNFVKKLIVLMKLIIVIKMNHSDESLHCDMNFFFFMKSQHCDENSSS